MTEAQRRLSQKYIIYRAFTSAWFIGAVWLYFYRIFITDQQVGFLDGMAFAIGLLAEVPSGALADKFGRARIVRLGQILIGSGLLIQAFGSSFMPFFVGQAITMIGIAFTSGAEEALFFQKLNFKRNSTHWRKLVTRGSQAALMGGFIATITGGWLHTIDPRFPWIVSGIVFIGTAFIIWNVTDDRPKKNRQRFATEVGEYLQNIKTGFSQFRLPKLWLYVPFIIAVEGLFYVSGYGLLRPVLLDRFHFDPFWGSVAVAINSLITVGILAYMHKKADHLSEKKVLVLIGLAAIASLLLSLADIGIWGFVVILALYAGEHVLHPFMSEILNNRAPESQRATILSVASFLRTLPYIILAPIIGYLSTHDQLEYFLIGWAMLIAIAIMLYVAAKKRDSFIELGESH